MIRRPPVLASLFTLAGLCVLIALGIWQLQRLQWKEGILYRLDQAYQATGLSRSGYPDIARAGALARIRVSGTYDHDREILIQPRTWQGQTGFHVVTPLRLAEGGMILVNRGWIPRGKKEQNQRPETLNTGMVDVTGILRKPEGKRLFTPENEPGRGNWFYINPEYFTNDYEKVASFMLYADSETGGGALPVREALRYEPPNNHRGYALFWFSMAGVLLVIYYLRFIHSRNKEDTP